MGLRRRAERLIRDLERRLTHRYSPILIAYLIAIIFFASGAVNSIIEGSRLGPGVLVAGSPRVQTGIESVIFGISLIMGMLGFYMIYRSARGKGGGSGFYTAIGMALVVIGTLLEVFMVMVKLM